MTTTTIDRRPVHERLNEVLHLAACRDMPKNMFFSDIGSYPIAAKAACRRCEISEVCLEDALARPTQGLRAGTTGKDRRKMLKGKRQPLYPAFPYSLTDGQRDDDEETPSDAF